MRDVRAPSPILPFFGGGATQFHRLHEDAEEREPITMEVIRVTPRGYCYGVVDAMEIARKAARDASFPRPIYIVGQIVHNRFAVEDLTKLGLITLEGPDRAAMVNQIENGTVIFTAHGVSPEVKRRANERGLHVIDATCPDVAKTHELVRSLVNQGYQIIYIGKKGHPEPEGVIGEAPEAVTLVETTEDIRQLPERVCNAPLLAVTTQTTLSQWDTRQLILDLQQRFPSIEVHNEICRATQVRQEAVARMAQRADLTVVVGDAKSNNTNRLTQVAEEIAGSTAIRVDSVNDLKPDLFRGKKRVAITAGASTPSHITRAVISYIEALAQEQEPSSPSEDDMR
jgi:4-hydroxy-3-methylbut-2-en-1-yl diphosphate reductase